jgi:hypothetical protein
MNTPSAPRELTDEQKRHVSAVLNAGCDREGAAKYAGCSWAELHHAMALDAKFAREVRKTEATTELRHMKNVWEAAGKHDQWRASIWWLERLAPERYGPRATGLVTLRQLRFFIAQIGTILTEEVRRPDDRRRLLGRLDRMAHSLERLLRDEFVRQDIWDNDSVDTPGAVGNAAEGDSDSPSRVEERR